eukprot:1159152-Pelagomonas_calceolata.AAC.3
MLCAFHAAEPTSFQLRARMMCVCMLCAFHAAEPTSFLFEVAPNDLQLFKDLISPAGRRERQGEQRRATDLQSVQQLNATQCAWADRTWMETSVRYTYTHTACMQYTHTHMHTHTHAHTHAHTLNYVQAPPLTFGLHSFIINAPHNVEHPPAFEQQHRAHTPMHRERRTWHHTLMQGALLF